MKTAAQLKSELCYVAPELWEDFIHRIQRDAHASGFREGVEASAKVCDGQQVAEMYFTNQTNPCPQKRYYPLEAGQIKEAILALLPTQDQRGEVTNV